MSRAHSSAPETPATRFLKQHKIVFTPHLYEYVPHGGTSESARALQVDEHTVIKTLIMEDEKKQPLIMLMHGDCKVSTKELARQAGRKHIEPCKPEVANRHSGYLVGGTSPFATRKVMPVFMESSIAALEHIYINGGRRGFLVGLSPIVLQQLLKPTLVQVVLK
jgi:Cys-tRNA(Pro) deacylase